MVFCLPQIHATAFLKELKDGSIQPDKLMDMSSQERRDFFAKIVGEDNAHEVNAAFESKLLLKDQQRGMVSWAKKVAGISEPVRKDLVSRINKLDRVLQPEDEKGFLADLAAKKLGTDVSYEEAQKITQLAQKATQERDKPTDNLSGVSDEYLRAADDLGHYVKSLKPVSALASIGKNAAIIARNNLLMNPSVPIKTTIGQVGNSALDLITRRIAAQSAGGANPELVSEANKEAWRMFRETGHNTASMESLDDAGKLGEKTRFDVPEGMLSANPALRAVESGVRNVARVSNKIAIDWEHNITFTKFYQKAFFDMLNIASTNLAKSEGLTGTALKSRASDIFKDAARVKPETDVGALVRMEGQKQAARITSTNDTYISRLALGVKDALNKTVPGLGDILMPIAKIPSNIIWNGIENAGVGLPMGVKDIFQGRAKIQSDDMVTRYEGMAQFANGIQRIARVVGVLGAAAYFTSQLTKKDFRSDPPGADHGNHFVKIGGVWINTEYINAISPALAGMMSVKQHGKPRDNAVKTASEYASGALQGLKSAPGIDELSGLVTSITNSNYEKGIKKYLQTFFTSRGEPAFIANLQKNRPINRLFFGAQGVETPQDVHQDEAQRARNRAKSPTFADGGHVHAAASETDPEPTDAQIEAGNYKKGKVSLHGFRFSIETPKGVVRRGVGADGKPWENCHATAHYGYILGHGEGADGDHHDAYIGPHTDSKLVFAVNQIDPKTKQFDEHKFIFGARTPKEARSIYDGGFSDGSGPKRRWAVHEIDPEILKGWLASGKTKKPFPARLAA